MAIFPKIECDDVVQVSDKFRISCVKSYVSKDEDAITKVEIEPEAGYGFIDVTGALPIRSSNWYLDWEYSSSGSKVISVKVTTEITGPTTQTISKTISCLTALEDKLLSNDQDLAALETDILKYVPEGRSTFNYAHREAQREILEWLYTNGFYKKDGSRYTIDNIIAIEDFKYWSKYMVLRLLYADFSKVKDDIFHVRSKKYENDEHKWRHKAYLKIDTDSNGTQGDFEGADMVSRNFIRE